MVLRMLSPFKLIADKLLAELRTTDLGNKISFVIGVYFEAKQIIEKPSLAYKLVTYIQWWN